MADITIANVTPDEQTALDWIAAEANKPIIEENARRAALIPPLPTLPLYTGDSYFLERARELLANYGRHRKGVLDTQLTAAVKQAPQATQDEIEAFVKLKLGIR